MKKRLFAIILTAAMVLLLFPVGASAVVGPGGNVSTVAELNTALGGGHTVSGNKVTLTQDVELSQNIDIQASADLQLDLAGWSITNSTTLAYSIMFRVFGKLGILDSSSDGSGEIEATNDKGAVSILGGATLDFYGGQIITDSADPAVSGNFGTLNLIGASGKIGTIKNNQSITLDVTYTNINSGAYVTVDGNPVTSISGSVSGEVKVQRKSDLPISLSALTGSGGSASVSPATSPVDIGSSPVVTLTPDSGYEVDKVFVNGVDSTSSLTGAASTKTLTLTNISVDTYVIGTFKQTAAAPTTILVQAGYGGSIDATSYAVTANSGYVIDQLWIDGTEVTAASGAAIYTPTPPTQALPTKSIIATFAYTVNFNSPANGTLTVARGSNLTSGTIVRGGDVLTITGTPDTNYTLSSLTINGTAVTPTNNVYTYTVGTAPGTKRTVGTSAEVMASGAQIVAAFAPEGAPPTFVAVTEITRGFAGSVGINADLPLTGTVIPPDATNRTIRWRVSANDAGTTGAIVSDGVFTATAAGTATVTAVISDGLAVGTDYTQEFDITVSAAPVPTNTVTVAGGTGGGDYAAGDPVTLTATPPTGQRFKAWTIDPPT